MAPDLLVGSASRGTIRLVSPDLGGDAPTCAMAEPTDALWVDQDLIWVAARHDDGGGAVVPLRRVGSELRPLAPIAVGELPCALRLHEGHLLVACYLGGQVDRLPGGRSDAPLESPRSVSTSLLFPAGSGASDRQRASHPHDVTVLGGGRVLICDLGADRLHILDEKRWAVVDSIVVESGAGPRKALSLPTGELLVVCELDSTLRCFTPDGAGFRQIDCVPTTSGPRDRNFAGDLVALSDGSVIVANRGNATVAGFGVDFGRIVPLFEQSGGGDWPASLDVRGQILAVANEHSDTLALWDVSPEGLMERACASSEAPSLVRFAPPSRHLSHNAVHMT